MNKKEILHQLEQIADELKLTRNPQDKEYSDKQLQHRVSLHLKWIELKRSLSNSINNL